MTILFTASSGNHGKFDVIASLLPLAYCLIVFCRGHQDDIPIALVVQFYQETI